MQIITHLLWHQGVSDIVSLTHHQQHPRPSVTRDQCLQLSSGWTKGYPPERTTTVRVPRTSKSSRIRVGTANSEMFAAFFTGLQKSIRSMHRSPSSAVQSCYRPRDAKSPVPRYEDVEAWWRAHWCSGHWRSTTSQPPNSEEALQQRGCRQRSMRGDASLAHSDGGVCPARNVVGQYEPSKKGVGKHLKQVCRSYMGLTHSNVGNKKYQMMSCGINVMALCKAVYTGHTHTFECRPCSVSSILLKATQ